MEILSHPLCCSTTMFLMNSLSCRQPLQMRCQPIIFISKHFSPLSFSVCTNLFHNSDFYSLRRDVEILSRSVEETRESAGIWRLEQELADFELKAADSSFWHDQAKAQEVLLTLTDVKDKIRVLTEFKTQFYFQPKATQLLQ